MIKTMQQRVVDFSNERDWSQFHTPKELAIALQLEASEVLEHFRFKEEFDTDEVAKEAADVLIVLLMFVHVADIDIEYWFERKLSENALKYPVSKCYGKNLKYTEL